MTNARKPGASNRTITADEAAIWNDATRALAPVKGKPRVAATQARTEARTEAQTQAKTQAKTQARTQAGRAAKPRGWQAAKPVSTTGLRPAPVELERRQARRIAAGKIAIGARLDLHGYRQDQARARLRTFLFAAHARGELTVLVITGKGASSAAGEPQDEWPRGVLRRHVPLWLAEPDLRAIVAGFGEANARHGGAGALYLRLRNPSRRPADLGDFPDQ